MTHVSMSKIDFKVHLRHDNKPIHTLALKVRVFALESKYQ